MKKKINSYKNLDLIVLGANFFTEGGDWRSIYYYIRESEGLGKKIKLIQIDKKSWFKKWLCTTLFGKNILVNCIAALSSPFVIITCLLRRDVVIYLHATEYALNNFKKTSPLCFIALRIIFRRNQICCVSSMAADYYKHTYGASRLVVVYEYPGNLESFQPRADRVQVLMCGSVNHRKGVELFSRVADIAHENGDNIDFHWVGGIATQSPLYRSGNVQWHGFTPHPRSVMEKCDVFFLTSIDDPCPLAALEALSLGKKTVSYRFTGTSELIEALHGCRVFEEYTPESAYNALVSSVREETLSDEIASGLSDKISFNQFSKRLASIFTNQK